MDLDHSTLSAHLPGDVLCEIFHACADTDKPNRHSLGWIRLSFVSRLWRFTILDLPFLWARVVCIYPRAHTTILLRTRDVPIVLDLVEWRYYSRSTPAAILINAARELLPRACAVKADDEQISQNHLRNRTLPTLRCLDLRSTGFVAPDLRSDMTTALNAPNLYELKLTRFCFPVRASNLRSLHLRDWRFAHHAFMTSILTLANYLQSFPALQDFSLSDSYDDSVSFKPSEWLHYDDGELPVVYLPRLQRVQLKAFPFLLSILWRILKAPHASVLFELRGLEHVDKLINSLRSFFDAGENNVLTLVSGELEDSVNVGPAEWIPISHKDLRERLGDVPRCCGFLTDADSEIYSSLDEIPFQIAIWDVLSSIGTPIHTVRAVEGDNEYVRESWKSPLSFPCDALCSFLYNPEFLPYVAHIELNATVIRPTLGEMRCLLHRLIDCEDAWGRNSATLVIRGLPVEWIDDASLRQRELDTFERHVEEVVFEH